MRTVNALGFGVGTLAEVGEVWNSPIPAIIDAVGTGSVGSPLTGGSSRSKSPNETEID